LIKANRLRAPGITAGGRTALFAVIPTLATKGRAARYSGAGGKALFLPRNARDLMLRVNGTLKENATSPRLTAVPVNPGADAGGDTADQFATLLQSEWRSGVKWSRWQAHPEAD
jgi:hypothetical protein